MDFAGMPLAHVAQQTAYALLGGMGARWRHSRGVAYRAAELAGPLGVDTDLLVAAAWLHDIGYAPPAVVSGFHPLDGAGYLAARRWPPRVAGLVANHSGAVFVAAARGLDDALAAFPDEGGVVADALTYADQTIGPGGERVTPQDRRAEMLRRHGSVSWNARVDHVRWPYLKAVAERVEDRLAAELGAALPV
ncbi:HD domain-containing protein [Krasilnikovia sp. MM14-A1259]|uniref:HD domain-containing protein n=1 Tax=Krasilnikovia sp. MM14-A1259 TaxID=3373539 RepID=UPI00399D3340